MQVAQEAMDKWAKQALRMSGCLLRLTSYLKTTSVHSRLPHNLKDDLMAARRLSILQMRSLVRSGASDPIDAAWIALTNEEPVYGLPSERQRTSPKSRAYAQAIRAAAIACREMETERGTQQALSDVLDDFAEQAEQELNQPPPPL